MNSRRASMAAEVRTTRTPALARRCRCSPEARARVEAEHSGTVRLRRASGPRAHPPVRHSYEGATRGRRDHEGGIRDVARCRCS